MYYIIGCKYVFYIPYVRESFRDRKNARVYFGQVTETGEISTLVFAERTGHPQRSKICERCFVMCSLVR